MIVRKCQIFSNLIKSIPEGHHLVSLAWPVCLGLLEFEDVLLLLVVGGHLAHCLPQADGDLVVVWDALACILVVLVEAHLLVVDDAVHVMPRPEARRDKDEAKRKSDSRLRNPDIDKQLAFI